MVGLLESQIPMLVVTISIILAGILIGVGRAFGSKKIEGFGKEELVQAAINAAIFGAVALIVLTTTEISKGIRETQCKIGATMIDELACIAEKQIMPGVFALFQETIKVLDILGYYQTLSLNFGTFSIQPLVNIESISNILSFQVYLMQLALILLNLNLIILNFIAQNALEMIFVVGLLLRMFFATRRVGGFLIALALGLYLFYPSFILAFPSPEQEVNLALNGTKNFTNNSFYAPNPIVDLNDNNAIAEKIDALSGRTSSEQENDNEIINIINVTNNQSNNTNETEDLDIIENIDDSNDENKEINVVNLKNVDFSSDLTVLTQANSVALAKIFMYSIIAPIFSLIITIVFIKEMGDILGGEIGIASIF